MLGSVHQFLKGPYSYIGYYGGYDDFESYAFQKYRTQGYSELSSLKNYLTDEFNKFNGILIRSAARVNNISDSMGIGKEALQIQVDSLMNDAKNLKQQIFDIDMIEEAEDAYENLDIFADDIADLAKAIDALPGVQSIGMSAKEIAEAARNSITEADKRRIREQGGDWDYYTSLVAQQVYAEKLLEQYKKLLGDDAVAYLSEQVDYAREGVKEADPRNNIFTMIDKTSDQVEEFRKNVVKKLGLFGKYTLALTIGAVGVGAFLLIKAMQYKKKVQSEKKKITIELNPYSKKAKYFHIRTEDPSHFKKFFVVDPGRKGHTKITVGVPKKGGKSRTQKIMIEKKYVPASKKAVLKRMEKQAEKKPYNARKLSSKLSSMGIIR